MFTKIGIISLPVENQQRAKDFFCDKLGFEVVRDNDFMGENQRWIELRPQSAQTSIVLTSWLEEMPAGSLKGTVLLTDAIEQTLKTLRENGVRVPELQSAPWGKYIELEDSEGNGWVIQQTAPDA